MEASSSLFEGGTGGGLLLGVIEKLLPSGARVLWIGDDRPAKDFVAAGYSVEAVHVAQGNIHPTVVNPLRETLLSLEGRGDACWDAVVFFETLACLSMVDVFDLIPGLLGDAGVLLGLDRVCLERLEETASARPWLVYLERMASRAGFSLEVLAQFPIAGSEDRVVLFQCRRTTTPCWRVGWIHEGRSSEMRALFRRVFDIEMSEQHWCWKYGQGRGCGIGVWRTDTGELVAHYGGTTRRAVFLGRDVLAFQACDLMVASEGRGSLMRQGPAFLAVASFLESQLGFGAAHLLGIGFPNERAYRLPERLGLYSGCLGRIQELNWQTEPLGWRKGLWACQEVRASDVGSLSVLDLCWKDMRDDMGGLVVGVRDAHYFVHRYLSHPDKTYRVLSVRHRLFRRRRGVVVLRRLEDDRFELMDVIGAIANVADLVRYARGVAGEAGAQRLCAWMVDNIVPFFPASDSQVDLGVLVPGNNWTPGPGNELVAGRWWLTGGDTDFR